MSVVFQNYASLRTDNYGTPDRNHNIVFTKLKYARPESSHPILQWGNYRLSRWDSYPNIIRLAKTSSRSVGFQITRVFGLPQIQKQDVSEKMKHEGVIKIG